jgi:hypothetical protein
VLTCLRGPAFMSRFTELYAAQRSGDSTRIGIA